jgi:hypothetical protein
MLKDFNSMKRCIVWLVGIVQEMTWDEHMTVAVLEIGEQWEAEGEILGEDLRLDAPPILNWEESNGVFQSTRLFPILNITVLKNICIIVMLSAS